MPAIETRVGQREALLTPQATNFQTVQAGKTPVSTGGQELASALGVLQPAFGAFANGFMKDKDITDVQAATAHYNGLTDADKALVIGHPAYEAKSLPFRRTLSELQTARANRKDNETLETEIRAGKLNDPAAIESRSQELRASSLGDTRDLDRITQYDTERSKSLTKYGLVGALIKGQKQLEEARVLSQEEINAKFQEGGYEAGMAAFRKNQTGANWSNADGNAVLLKSLEASVFAKWAHPAKSLEMIEQMRNQEIKGADGKVIGIFGNISGHGDKLAAMQTQVMTLGAKEATLQIEAMSLGLDRIADKGDVPGTTNMVDAFTKNQNPAVAEHFKKQFANAISKAESAQKAITNKNNADQLVAEIETASKIVTRQDYAALVNPNTPMGSVLEQDATSDVTLLGPGGVPVTKRITVTAEERKKNLQNYANERSNADHAENPKESNADWFLRDHALWSRHGMVPPHHAVMAKQGVSAMRNVGDNTETVSPDAVQTLRQFQLLQNNQAAAKELFGSNYEYLSDIDQLERMDGKGTKEAARLINQVDKKYAEVPGFKKSVDDAAVAANTSSLGWFKGTVKNGADLSGDIKRYVMIAMSDGKTQDAAILYAKQRIDAMPTLHGSKVRPSISQLLVTDANTTPDELLQSYIKENLTEKNRVPKELMDDSSLSPVEEGGKVVGFKFKMNMANKGYWMLFGAGKEAAPMGYVKDFNGADIYLPIDQINKYGADASTEYGRLRSTRASRVEGDLRLTAPRFRGAASNLN